MQLIAPGHASGGRNNSGRTASVVLSCSRNLCTISSTRSQGLWWSTRTLELSGQYLPQPVLLHAGLVGGWRWAMLELRVKQSVRGPTSSAARPAAAAAQVHASAQSESEAALAPGRCHSPSGTTYSYQNHADSCKKNVNVGGTELISKLKRGTPIADLISPLLKGRGARALSAAPSPN